MSEAGDHVIRLSGLSRLDQDEDLDLVYPDDPSRPCDFCGAIPSGDWLMFDEGRASPPRTFPSRLSTCSNCITVIDRRDAAGLVELFKTDGYDEVEAAALATALFHQLEGTRPFVQT